MNYAPSPEKKVEEIFMGIAQKLPESTLFPLGHNNTANNSVKREAINALNTELLENKEEFGTMNPKSDIVTENAKEIQTTLAKGCKRTIDEIKGELGNMGNNPFLTGLAAEDLAYNSSLHV